MLCDQVRRAGGVIFDVPGDITDEGLRRSIIRLSVEQLGGLDILINNAGIGARGPFASSSPETLRQVFEVNFFAAAELTRLALPELVKGTTPLLVNLGSVLGHRAVPNKSEYCSSKFALHGFSDALRAELWRQRIHVMLVSPSTTDSEFFDHVLVSPLADSETQSTSPPAETRAGITRPFRGMPPDRVARKIVRAMRRDRDELVLSAGGTCLVWLDRLSPSLANWLVRRFP